MVILKAEPLSAFQLQSAKQSQDLLGVESWVEEDQEEELEIYSIKVKKKMLRGFLSSGRWRILLKTRCSPEQGIRNKSTLRCCRKGLRNTMLPVRLGKHWQRCMGRLSSPHHKGLLGALDKHGTGQRLKQVVIVNQHQEWLRHSGIYVPQ